MATKRITIAIMVSKATMITEVIVETMQSEVVVATV
jgi:hypothetical protein